MKEPAPSVTALDGRAALRITRNPLKRGLYLAIGSISVALGTLGIFIRGILPTVPFLLLAAWCYGRSSERMYRWIYGHRIFGPILIDWEEHKSLSRRTKRVSVASVWIGILVSMTALHFTVPAAREAYLQAMLLVIATCVTTFLSTRPTRAGETGLSRRTKAFVVTVLLVGPTIAGLILQLNAAPVVAWYLTLGLIALVLVLGTVVATQPPVRQAGLS